MPVNTSVFDIGVDPASSEETGGGEPHHSSVGEAISGAHFFRDVLGVPPEEQELLHTAHANLEDLYTDPRYAQKIKEVVKKKNRFQKSIIGQEVINELTEAADTALRIHEEIQKTSDLTGYRKQAEDLQKEQWHALYQNQAELLKEHGIAKDDADAAKKAQTIIESAQKLLAKDPAANIDEVLLSSARNTAGKTTEAYQAGTRVSLGRVQQQFSERSQKIAEQGTDTLISYVIRDGLPDQVREALKSYKPAEGKTNPLNEITARLKKGETIKYDDIISTLRGSDIKIDNLTPAGKTKLENALNLTNRISASSYVQPQESSAAQTQTAGSKSSVEKTPIPVVSQVIPAVVTVQVPSPVKSASDSKVQSPVEKEKPIPYATSVKPPATAEEFTKSVIVDMEHQLDLTEKVILQKKAELNQKKAGGFQTKKDKAELKKLQEAQVVVAHTEKTLTDPRKQKKLSALITRNPEELKGRIAGFHQVVINNKEVAANYLNPNVWLFKNVSASLPHVSLSAGSVGTPSFKLSFPFFNLGNFKIPKINLSGLFGNLGNLFGGLKSLIGKVFSGGIGNFLKGLPGKILSSALIKGLGGLLSGGIIPALSLASGILKKLTFGFIDIEGWITKAALFAVLGIVGVFILAIILTLFTFVNLACSVPIIGCGSINIIQNLPHP